jgi:hypothetical protein
MAPEVFRDAATLSQGASRSTVWTKHDTEAVVAGLCADPLSADPGAAVRGRHGVLPDASGNLHDADGAAAAHLIAAQIVQLRSARSGR